MQVENNVDRYRADEKQEGDYCEYVDLVADAFEVFKELLLLEGIAVGGFADRFELVFDALERCVLVSDLRAELALLCLERADALFEGSEVDGRCWRRGPVRRRSHEIGDSGADVAIEQGKDPLYERQSGANGVDRALKAGLCVCSGRRSVCGGRGRGQAAARGNALSGLDGGGAA